MREPEIKIEAWKNSITNAPVKLITDGGYTAIEVLNNKNCSKDPKYWYPIEGTSRYLFRSSVAESWEFFAPFVENPVRNTNQIYLRFLDSSIFCSEAFNFTRQGFYTNFPEDSIGFINYWDTQEDLCRAGNIVDGVRITGRHYFSVNFGRLKALPIDENGVEGKRKIWTFLRFLDHQYYMLNELEEAIVEGMYLDKDFYLAWYPLATEEDFITIKKEGFVTTKSRRKGYSYIIDNALYAYNYVMLEASKNFLGAHEKTHYETTISGIHSCINFLNKYTDFGKRSGVLSKREHFRASYKYIDENGTDIEDGFMSEIECVSFKNNPFKSVGSSADFFGYEEMGKADNFLETFPVSIEPLLRDGEIFIGTFIGWGSSGDIDGGGSKGLYEVQYNPKQFGIKSYKNIYSEKPSEEEVGWFIDDLWYSPSYTKKEDLIKLTVDKNLKTFIKDNYGNLINGVDRQGNSHRFIAKIILLKKRDDKKGVNSVVYNKFITQQPIYLEEAFLSNEVSPFDVALATQVLGELKVKKDRGEPTEFIRTDSGIKPILNTTLRPVEEFPTPKDANLEGCWVIYAHPVRGVDNKIIPGRYLFATDPIDFSGDEKNSKGGSHSLAATYVLDSFTRTIVAEYVGRPRIIDTYYENLIKGIEYYNGELLYENNLKGLYTYFRNKNKLYLLADEPICLKDKAGYKYTNSMKGFHATETINSWGRDLIHKWSIEDYVIGQEEATGVVTTIPRMWSIRSIALLQEIIRWNKQGNFDRISSFGALMIFLVDREKAIESRRTEVKSVFNSKLFRRIDRVMPHSYRMKKQQEMYEKE